MLQLSDHMDLLNALKHLTEANRQMSKVIDILYLRLALHEEAELVDVEREIAKAAEMAKDI